MTLFSCAAVRRRLAAFHDRELPVRELIDVQDHSAGCAQCAAEIREMRLLGEALRQAAAPGPADDWTGLQSGVISRMRAEAHESWTARTGRMFDDMHLIWIGLAATLATFICGAVALGSLQFASSDREDSLAAVMAMISQPSGSNLNPVRADHSLKVPNLSEGGAIEVMLAQPLSHEELVLALSAVVTREGRVSGLFVLNRDGQEDLTAILEALSRAQLEPGRMGTSPVAVNLVWLLAHTTVRAKAPPQTTI